MSERITARLSSLIKPMAIPATGADICTPASIRASVPPPTRASKGPNLPHAERRKVIMKHKGLRGFPFQDINPLFVFRRSEGHHGQTLRLAARKERRAGS